MLVQLQLQVDPRYAGINLLIVVLDSTKFSSM